MTPSLPTPTVVGALLGVVGFVVGGFLAVALSILLWPGGVTAWFLIVRPPPPPEAIRHAELMYGALLGLFGAIVPALGYRVGFAIAAAFVVSSQSHYWATHDLGQPLLLAAGVWLVVAGALAWIAEARRSRSRPRSR